MYDGGGSCWAAPACVSGARGRATPRGAATGGDLMPNQEIASRTRRGGRHWVFAAGVAVLSAGLLWVAVHQERAWHACLGRHASSATPARGSCAATYSWLALSTVGLWMLAIVVTVTGGAV